MINMLPTTLWIAFSQASLATGDKIKNESIMMTSKSEYLNHILTDQELNGQKVLWISFIHGNIDTLPI